MLRAGDQNRDGRLDLADMGSVTVTCLQSLFVQCSHRIMLGYKELDGFPTTNFFK